MKQRIEVKWENYPKVVKYLVNYYVLKFPNVKEALTDELIKQMVEASPTSILSIFDEKGFIGTIHYEMGLFQIYVNGSIVKYYDNIGYSSREKAENELALHLLNEVEKTL